MSEPEDVILDGAHHASAIVAALWRRRHPGPPRLRLTDVKARLDLLISALFDTPPVILPAEPPPRPTPLARWVRRIPRHMLHERAHAATDGIRLRLPPDIEATEGEAAAWAYYRILALGQAARIDRGSVLPLLRVDDPLVRDLYWLAEGVAVDEQLAHRLPGWAGDIGEARARALARRPALSRPTESERAVDALVRGVLEHPPSPPPDDMPALANPCDSLAWAEDRAHEWRHFERGYRGVPAVPFWGVPETSDARALERLAAEDDPIDLTSIAREGTMPRRPRVRDEIENEDDDNSGMWGVQLDDPQEHVEDPMGLQRPTDRDDDADSHGLADSLSELPEARVVHTPGNPAEILTSPAPPERRALRAPGESRGRGVAYPEWDHTTESYRPAHALVRERPAPSGDSAWSRTVVERHAPQLRAIRRTFERLRPRRTRLTRQLDGDDLDLSAWVANWADRRAGGAVDDRVYEAVRPARREIAITLLVDVSGSTDSWVAGSRRVIDVAKEALLLVCEGLDALGDRYNVLAFSGEGPRGVELAVVKPFHEPYRADVKDRIAGLYPDRFTRVGAAVRHASALLSREPVAHRLLLLLSDGKPNDVDQYEGRYGIEDARQSIAEARLQRIHPFCLTIDRQAPTWAHRIFGPAGFTVLRDPARLPDALVRVVQQLIET